MIICISEISEIFVIKCCIIQLEFFVRTDRFESFLVHLEICTDIMNHKKQCNLGGGAAHVLDICTVNYLAEKKILTFLHNIIL